jgi:hypothetical protein
MSEEPAAGINVEINDDIHVTESAVVKGSGDDGSELVRISRGGIDGRQASADLAADGNLDDEIHGHAPHKEASELRAAAALVTRLNEEGGQWSTPKQWEGPEEGVDCMAEGPNRELLRIQVTTPERKAWKQLASQSSIIRQEQVADAVQAMKVAIESKVLKAHPDTVLVLDATDSARYALDAVVAEFSARYGTWAAGVDFAAVWIAGPTTDMVHRLDRS